jgi:hypothetical protein
MGARVWCISLALLLMAAAAPGMAAQGEPGGTAAPSTIKAESVSELAVRAAALQLELAKQGVARAERQVAEGTAGKEMVTAAQLKVSEATLALEQAKQAATDARTVTQRISAEIKDATLDDALRAIFKDTDQSVVVQSGIVVGALVNLSLKNVPLEDAVKVVTELNGLEYKRVGNVWIVSQKEGVVTIGGARVPLLGALPDVPGESVFERRVGDETLLFTIPRIVRETGAALGPVLGSPARVDFPGSETLVDLDVKDAPLSEVVAKLSAAVNVALTHEAQRLVGVVQAAEHVEIIAHESLKNVRVTAKVYRWPAGQVLGMLIEQTGVVCSEEVAKPLTLAQVLKEVAPEGGVVKLARTARIYLVPKPVLEVTGPGIPEPGSGGVGGGGGGGGGGRAGGGGGGGRAGTGG